MRKSSQAKPASLLIVAVSGRALAEAARRAGLAPLVADFFADADTAQIAQACRKLDGRIGDGIAEQALQDALDALARQALSPVLGCVYGSGFEDRPELLARIGARWPLLGNDAETVERVKTPASFFGTLQKLGVAHPRTEMQMSATGGAWLRKRQGGAGGSHIVAAEVSGANRAKSGTYFQERIDGTAISGLFVGDGARSCVLGFSEQWTAPRRGHPFRYGGAARPAELSRTMQDQMTEAVQKTVAAFGLKGLGSADFLVTDAAEALLLEINPRPGATLDIFDSGEAPLLQMHLDAVLEGRLPAAAPRPSDAAAAAIAFAGEETRIPEGIDWPDWAADRPRCGECIDKNRPICTVWARAETKARAKRLVEERISIILAACGPKNAGGGKRDEGDD